MGGVRVFPMDLHTLHISGDDMLLTQAWNAIGDYYSERQRYRHAVTYYSQGRNYEQLADCYYRLEDFTSLRGIVGTLPPNSPLLEVCVYVCMSVCVPCDLGGICTWCYG